MIYNTLGEYIHKVFQESLYSCRITLHTLLHKNIAL